MSLVLIYVFYDSQNDHNGVSHCYNRGDLLCNYISSFQKRSRERNTKLHMRQSVKNQPHEFNLQRMEEGLEPTVLIW